MMTTNDSEIRKIVIHNWIQRFEHAVEGLPFASDVSMNSRFSTEYLTFDFKYDGRASTCTYDIKEQTLQVEVDGEHVPETLTEAVKVAMPQKTVVNGGPTMTVEDFEVSEFLALREGLDHYVAERGDDLFGYGTDWRRNFAATVQNDYE